MDGVDDAERFETVIIGGGQAGLSTGFHLTERGRQFVILDANDRIGDAWRKRWDSLLLFTPSRINRLSGMPFPGPGDAFVGKDEMADYLEAYARRFGLPVRTGTTVESVTRRGDRFVVSARGRRFEADNVVVATSDYQKPYVPSFADQLDPGIVQLHSSEYRNPSQLRDGGVLVVGAGNSGADIGIEVARSHHTWMSGKEFGHVPFRIETLVARRVLIRIVRFVGHHVLTTRTPIGRKVRPKFLAGAAPLVRVKPKDLLAAGIERVPRVAGVRDGFPMMEDEQVIEVANIIWCTGFRPGFSWIDLPVFGERHEPLHQRGVVAKEPGLYFVGLKFLFAATSDTVTGIQRDTRYIARQIASRARRGHRAAAGAASSG